MSVLSGAIIFQVSKKSGVICGLVSLAYKIPAWKWAITNVQWKFHRAYALSWAIAFCPFNEK